MKRQKWILSVCVLSICLATGCTSLPKRNVTIAPMGDSLTQGIAWAQNDNCVGYRKSLAAELDAAGYRPLLVGVHQANSRDITTPGCKKHIGFSGFVIQEGHGRPAFSNQSVKWLDQTGYPDAALLLIGTNDIDIHPRQDVKAGEEVFGWWLALVKKLTAARPGTWFVVATIPDQNLQANGRCVASINTFNENVRSLFEMEQSTLTLPNDPTPVTCVKGRLNGAGEAVFGKNAKILFADINLATPAGKEFYSTDRLHPTQKGQDRWTAVWKEVLMADVLNTRAGGTRDAWAIVGVASKEQGKTIQLTFNHELALSLSPSSFTVEENVPSAVVRSAEGRTVTLTFEKPVKGTLVVTSLRDARDSSIPRLKVTLP
ncbi:MAG: GDSL-type esterase/lipase family protein [Kiritimatiellia bacterium]